MSFISINLRQMKKLSEVSVIFQGIEDREIISPSATYNQPTRLKILFDFSHLYLRSFKFKYYGPTPECKNSSFQLLDFISSGFRNWPPKMWVKRGKKDSIKNFKSLCAFHNVVESFIKEQRNSSSLSVFTRYFLNFLSHYITYKVANWPWFINFAWIAKHWTSGHLWFQNLYFYF